ncbi:hypothetical protein M5689_015183 [Euphorbia peplus]|nr:hypothetical protein M5689_015183 [Euphorbia peplus]
MRPAKVCSNCNCIEETVLHFLTDCKGIKQSWKCRGLPLKGYNCGGRRFSDWIQTMFSILKAVEARLFALSSDSSGTLGTQFMARNDGAGPRVYS